MANLMGELEQIEEELIAFRSEMSELQNNAHDNNNWSNCLRAVNQNYLHIKIECLELRRQLVLKEGLILKAADAIRLCVTENNRTRKNANMMRTMAKRYKTCYQESQTTIQTLKDERDKLQQDYENLQNILRSNVVDNNDDERTTATTKSSSSDMDNDHKRSHDTPEPYPYMSEIIINEEQSLSEEFKCMNCNDINETVAATMHNSIYNSNSNLIGSSQDMDNGQMEQPSSDLNQTN